MFDYDDMHCNSCRFFVLVDGLVGECHKNPPMPGDQKNNFPAVSVTSYCGEYSAMSMQELIDYGHFEKAPEESGSIFCCNDKCPNNSDGSRCRNIQIFMSGPTKCFGYMA